MIWEFNLIHFLSEFSQHWLYSWLEMLYNFTSGSWLACVNNTTVHYAAIHCPRQQTIGPSVCSQSTYHRLSQPHDHVHLHRHVGVNNLPRVVTWYWNGWQLNPQLYIKNSELKRISGWPHVVNFFVSVWYTWFVFELHGVFMFFRCFLEAQVGELCDDWQTVVGLQT